MKCTGELSDEQIASAAVDLKEKCLSLDDFDPEVGLTKETVDTIFAANDGKYRKQRCLTVSIEIVNNRLCS